MGRTQTCNFQCVVNISNGDSPIYGAMTLKGIRGILTSEKDHQSKKGHAVVKIEVFPQTKRGQTYMKGNDFLIMDNEGTIDYYKIGDKIPFYCF